jgi:hypothetical protein
MPARFRLFAAAAAICLSGTPPTLTPCSDWRPQRGVPLVLTVDAAALADAGSRASLALAAVANAAAGDQGE